MTRRSPDNKKIFIIHPFPREPMKKPGFLLVFILLLIAGACIAGCTTQTPAAAPSAVPAAATVPATPDITGTWTGLSTGYEPVVGFTDYGNSTMLMNVSEQKGRLFAGTFVFTGTNGTQTIAFSGVIGRDGRTLTLPQKTGGYSFGEIIAPDQIELIYVDDGARYSSVIDTLRKV
jgi:hypothetical protein